MKTTLILLCALVLGACSKFTRDNQKPKAVLLTHRESIDTLRNSADSLLPVSFIALDQKEKKLLLRSFDLGPVLYDSDSLDQYSNRFDGFFGADRYRIEIYWNSVKRDSIQHHLYYISGKTRFKGKINDYTGTLSIDSVYRFNDPNIADRYYEEGALQNEELFEFTGRIRLNEDSLQKGSGIFDGKIVIDVAKSKKENSFLWFYTPETKTLGSGFKADGIWTSHQTGARKSFVFARDLFIFANNILADFSYGEREVEINPKYRHLGWQDFWEMNEWWADKAAVVQ